MIQELLGGVHVEERKISIPGGLIADGSSSFPSTSCTSISSPSQSSATSSPSATSENHQNLRCPRCDSSNTKFCYYNNYNLTQPRHFCKTCRRYWTKGGALRNVPIGGGCRKTKAATPSIAASGGKSGGNKAKPMVVDAMGRPSLGGGLEHDLLPSSPILWANMPQSSQLLALLRASQIQNASPNPTSSLLNSIRIKEEGAMIGSHMAAEANGTLNVHSLSLDTLGQLPIGPCSSSLWRNEGQYQYQQQQQQQQQQNMLLGEVPTSSGIQELYQRLRSSVNYGNDHLQVITNNVGSPFTSSPAAATTTMATTTTTTSILDPVPLSVGEFGYWNPVLSWSDLPTTNGAFP